MTGNDRDDSLDHPPKISVIGLAKRFANDHRKMSNRSFSFVLGAGASASSGIKTAGQMVADWTEDLYHESTDATGGSPKEWATAESLGIAAFDPENPAASYSDLYSRMFRHDPDRGFAYLEHAMKDAEPSFGYSVLARIAASERHRAIITTNFDNLVADSLSLYSETYPLVCGHELLAGFVKARTRRPLVVKVHRDLLLAPKNTPDDLSQMPEPFKLALTTLFREHTPIVIGYAGNDQSLMAFLNQLPENSVPGGVYWCYWDRGPTPPEEIQRFVARQRGTFVEIPGFDETMMLIGEELGYDVPEQLLLDRAKQRADRVVKQAEHLQKRLLELKRSKTADTDEEERVEHETADAITRTMLRSSGTLRWWQWEARASAEPNLEQRAKIYKEAIAALPHSSELIGNYASLLDDIEQHEAADAFYKRAIDADPGNAINLGNYANFLKNVRADPDAAETFYKKAIEADPENTINLGNYAIFLKNVRADYDAAETFYKRAIEADPVHANNLGNYALFLDDIRGDHDAAETFYKKAIEANPEHANTLGNYAIFLEDVRRDHGAADAAFQRAIDADPKHSDNVGNYARFLLAHGRIDRGLKELNRVLSLVEEESTSTIHAEVWMYAACHQLPDDWRQAVQVLKRLVVDDGITTDDWDYSGVIDQAKQREHPASQWLDPLAEVVGGRAEPATLDGWDAWANT